MTRKKLIQACAVALIVFGMNTLGLQSAKADSGALRSGSILVGSHVESEFPSLAKISPSRALEAALARVKGKVLRLELEDENGFLVYGVELVTQNNLIKEVKVDAGTGTVLIMNQDNLDNHNERSGEGRGEREDHQGGERD